MMRPVEEETNPGELGDYDAQYGQAVDRKVGEVVVGVMCAYKEAVMQLAIGSRVER